MKKIANVAAGATALALLGAGLSGCSGSSKVEPDSERSVSAADLQKTLTERFAAGGGSAPQSVTCKEDLVREVGKKATCDVVVDADNSVQTVLTVIKVNDTGVDYDISPAYTKEQLQKAISGMTSTPDVTCDSGLPGSVGATANCDVTVNGITAKRRATVEGVSELSIDIGLSPIATKQQVQDLLMQKLLADGQQAETVECVDDVVAKPGSAVECTIVSGGQSQAVVVTMTSVDGDNIDFDYSAKP